jgi:hypothetical protein
VRFEAGQFVTFTYRPPAKPPKRPRQVLQNVRQPDGTIKQTIQVVQPKEDPPSDPSKYVLILHPSYHNQVHAIDLKRLTPAQVQTLRAIFDPKVKAAVDRGEWPVEGAPPYPLVRDILRRMEPLEAVKNPVLAYATLVKPFLGQADAYRKYATQWMFSAKVVEESHVKGQVVNPRPLFHRTESRQGPAVVPPGGKSPFKKV